MAGRFFALRASPATGNNRTVRTLVFLTAFLLAEALICWVVLGR